MKFNSCVLSPVNNFQLQQLYCSYIEIQKLNLLHQKLLRLLKYLLNKVLLLAVLLNKELKLVVEIKPVSKKSATANRNNFLLKFN